MKTCSKCKIIKDLSEFHKSNQTKDGLKHECKSCRSTKKPDSKDGNGILIKTCSTCNQQLSVDNFSASKKGKYGVERECKSCRYKYIKKWAQEHKEQRRQQLNTCNLKHRAQRLEYKKRYKKENRQKVNALNSKRRADKLHRTPAYADLKAIEKFYIDAPDGMEVDHIIPLKGKTISGFHVLNNLQYLTSKENDTKGNRFPYYPLEFYRSRGLIF